MTQLSKAIEEKLKACESLHTAHIAPVSVGMFREMARRLLAAEARELVPLAEAVAIFREYNIGCPVERFKADYVIGWTLHHYAATQPVTVPDGLRLALSNAGIAAPESDEMLFATHEKYVQLLVDWVKERKPFLPAAPQEHK